ncbi:MAG: 3-phosphoshikimate 1-carboxyvinyltransferase, partial [Anaerolineae bacterium]
MSELGVRAGAPLLGRVRVPGDKSISHRALLLGAIASADSHVDGFLPSADCLATLDAVRALGVVVDEHSPTTLTVHGAGLRGLREPAEVIDCRRSGTTMRLLAGLLAGQPFLSVLSGDAQLRRRPMARVVEPLRSMGPVVLGRDGGRLPPLAIQGGELHGIDYSLPVASAQVKSALLLAALYARGVTRLSVPGPARDHTERMLAAMGAE